MNKMLLCSENKTIIELFKGTVHPKMKILSLIIHYGLVLQSLYGLFEASVVYLSVKDSDFIKKGLHLCSEDE